MRCRFFFGDFFTGDFYSGFRYVYIYTCPVVMGRCIHMNSYLFVYFIVSLFFFPPTYLTKFIGSKTFACNILRTGHKCHNYKPILSQSIQPVLFMCAKAAAAILCKHTHTHTQETCCARSYRGQGF